MAKLCPFRGYVYNTKKIKNASRVVAPPYDVISASLQDTLYQSHAYNIVRLILNKKAQEGTQTDYRIVKDIFADWIRNGVLVQDQLPHVYVCAEHYTIGTIKKIRFGFFARVKLEDFSRKKVLPHERIIDVHMQDRLNLLRKVEANLSPVFSVFPDTHKKIARFLRAAVARKKPYLNLVFQGVGVKLWKIADPKMIQFLCTSLRSKQLFIADGHHRYQAGLYYRDEMKKKHPYQENDCDSIMMYLVSSDDDGLLILPTHRLLKDASLHDEKKILSRLQMFCEVIPMPNAEKVWAFMHRHKEEVGCFGLATKKRHYFVFKVKSTSEAKPYLKGGLDVDILHRFIFDEVLELKGKLDPHKTLFYTSNREEAAKMISSKKADAVFFLNPTRMEQVKKIALQGGRMPQKSTFFYPKILSGLVINKFTT